MNKNVVNLGSEWASASKQKTEREGEREISFKFPHEYNFNLFPHSPFGVIKEIKREPFSRGPLRAATRLILAKDTRV
jgi:hypothetical protein